MCYKRMSKSEFRAKNGRGREAGKNNLQSGQQEEIRNIESLKPVQGCAREAQSR